MCDVNYGTWLTHKQKWQHRVPVSASGCLESSGSGFTEYESAHHSFKTVFRGSIPRPNNFTDGLLDSLDKYVPLVKCVMRNVCVLINVNHDWTQSQRKLFSVMTLIEKTNRWTGAFWGNKSLGTPISVDLISLQFSGWQIPAWHQNHLIFSAQAVKCFDFSALWNASKNDEPTFISKHKHFQYYLILQTWLSFLTLWIPNQQLEIKKTLFFLSVCPI